MAARFETASALQRRVVLISGDDPVSRASALEELTSSEGIDPSETEQFQADAKDPSEWCGLAATVPFFSERRTVIVRSIGRYDVAKRTDESIGKNHSVVRLLAALPETSLLVLVHDEDSGDDDRQQRLRKSADVWAKIVDLAGGKSYVFNEDPSRTLVLIREAVAKHDKTISEKAANTLAQMVGNKPGSAIAEAEKAALFAGESPEVREADVKAAVTPDLEYNAFKLVDAVVAGDAATAVTQVRLLFGRSPDASSMAIQRVFPVLVSQFRALWQARFCLDSGTNPVHPDAHVERWLPEKRLGNEPDWRQRKIVGAAKRLSLHQISGCIGEITAADAMLKGALPSYSAGDTVERMTLTMCRLCGAKA
ncbi:MAG: hypothetical protein JST30_16700 [Armatimonadetes bacterium]|nr:hypothetical protein [Armatimonadota bacterium]